MKKIFLLILPFTFYLLTLTLHSQWVQQTSGTTQHLYDVYFINTQTGWACGNNGTMLKTTDGGNNWTSLNSGTTSLINSLYFLNENIGFAVTRVTGIILKTIDGGLNWNIIFQSSTASFNRVYFKDSLYGWAACVGLPNDVFRTTNGGLSWDSINVVAQSDIGEDVYFLDQMTGWLCMAGGIYKSTNGGVNWNFQYWIPNQGYFIKISFINNNTGWLITEGYYVHKTTNGGINWFQQTSVFGKFSAECIIFLNENTGYLSGGAGYMYKSTNTGFNWLQQQTNTNSFLRSIIFLNDTIGYACGGGGRIIYTQSGGAYVGIIQLSENVSEHFTLLQNFPNPFNSETVIRFNISNPENYNLEVFDILGRTVDIIFQKFLLHGEYQVNYSAAKLSSGIYFYKLLTVKYSETRKFVLIK